MINANEFRIGNVVYCKYRHGHYLITEINETDIRIKEPERGYKFWESYKNVIPISLSAEILEACGFEKDGFNCYNICISPWPESHLKQLSFSGDYIYLREGELGKNRINDSLCVLWNNDLRGKMSLHQIQNMFFCLTGNELTINLEKVKV